MATVLITGGNGLIGRHLSRRLQEEGYDVIILSRAGKKMSGISVYTWDWEKAEMELRALDQADYIVHLAGVNIGAKRWTGRRKKEILDSRVKTAQFLYHAVREKNKDLKAFISASATGYYGSVTSDRIHMESDPPANDFLGEVCRKWEQSAQSFTESGIRTVIIRTGVVLTKEGGILSRLTKPVHMGFGSALGSGRQYLPWIHMEDLCGIYIKAIKDVQMKGPYNAVAPEHITNEKFTRTLAYVLKKPFWLPGIPSWLMRLLFGRLSDMLLKGSRVSSERICNAGYSFIFRDLESAFYDLLRGGKS